MFELPWDCGQFIRHMVWSEQTLVQYRRHRCRKWLSRAKELEETEWWGATTDTRPLHLRDATREALLSEAGFEKVFRTENWVRRRKLFCR